jgi:hypothetical protein
VEIDNDQTWYHGSPLELTSIRAGSTITQNRDLARVFSHKPPIVSMNDDGSLKHTGATPGYLYRIAEPLGAEDVYPHPNSSMPPGAEWLCRRELRLALLGPTVVRDEERLTEQELADLRRRYGAPEEARE